MNILTYFRNKNIVICMKGIKNKIRKVNKKYVFKDKKLHERTITIIFIFA